MRAVECCERKTFTLQKMTMETQSFEKLKLIYENASMQMKFYMSWRQNLLAGYFAVDAGLFYALYKIQEDVNFRVYSDKIGYAIAVISCIFFLLDYRNKLLFQKCLEVGAAIENKINETIIINKDEYYGVYDCLNRLPEGENITHTFIVTILYGLGGFTGLYIACKF
ncbi:hypothetical protein C3K47_00320 [Solitalea longa]|uniref:Uncharacterized protein n=1 Tax=Solitalea longa TaxID=2079460 RepID=A0A2S5A8R4_9SPHI|nr:hypothetical protein [Solitalea longa]POY38981.1 hypothetical protein C3K47_00320 [Solitalea longa]